MVLSSTDMIPSLQTGMINCLADPPLYVYTAGMYEKANQMIDLSWGVLVGATLVKKDTWERIPAATREKLLVIAKEYGARTDAEVKKLNDDAVAQMRKKGLQLVPVPDLAAWHKAAENSWTVLRGKTTPAEFFDEVKRLRDEYRARKK